MDYTYHYRSPLGKIVLTGNGEALTGLWFDGQKRPAGAPEAALTARVGSIVRAERAFVNYFAPGVPAL